MSELQALLAGWISDLTIPYVQLASAVLLVVAGGSIIYYWWASLTT